jgi:hypothetical protein
MMNSNRYINVTKLCLLAGKNKHYSKWTKTQHAQEFMDKLAKLYPKTKLTYTRKGNINSEIQGTYVHSDLIPHIGSWASIDFALEVSKIVNEFRVKQEKERVAKLLRKKDNKIDQLLTEAKKQTKKMDELEENNNEFKKDNKILLNNNKKLM